MDKVEAFRALHVPGDPLVLFNIWDAGSANAVTDGGAKAIATGSYGVAEAQGFKDGETLPLEVVLENLRRIVSITELPVTIDMEAGYGETPDEVQVSVDRAREVGAVGINMEDRMPGKTALLPVAEAAETYTLLTIGDGLVAQIPALIISTAPIVNYLVALATRRENAAPRRLIN